MSNSITINFSVDALTFTEVTVVIDDLITKNLILKNTCLTQLK
jgi:hypothetical protein